MCKDFTLSSDTNKKIDSSKHQADAKGSHFMVGETYVDYAALENGESVTEITKTLLEKEYLLLESQVKI